MFDSLIDRIERNERISTLAGKIKHPVQPLIGDGALRDVLTGRWLGHPAHPAIVVAPLTGWFAGTLLDVVGGPPARRSAQRLVGLGTLAAVPAASTGVAEWLTTGKAEERIGTVHAALADMTTVPRWCGDGRCRCVPGRSPVVPARRRRDHRGVPERPGGLDAAAARRRAHS
jgi:hypothetical protein